MKNSNLSNNIVPCSNEYTANIDTSNIDTSNIETANTDISNTDTSNNISYIEAYIKALIENINHENLPHKINVIFDGGALNGFYAIGIALYLQELEKQEIVVDKVSGCSSGAVVALNYLMKNFHFTDIFFKKLVTSFHCTHTLKILPTLLRENVYYLFDNDDSALDAIQNRLYISYYDMQEKTQHVVHSYKSRDELIEYLIRSSYIPYIIDGEKLYKKRYIDGISPHIFSDKIPKLFVKLFFNGRTLRCIMTKSEENPHHRIMAGVSDANDFFTTGSSIMCSYIHNWSFIENLMFRIRSMLVFFILNIMECIIYLKKFVPDFICNSFAVQGIHRFITDIFYLHLRPWVLAPK